MTPRAPLAAAIAVGLLLAGCSSDPEPSRQPHPHRLRHVLGQR